MWSIKAPVGFIFVVLLLVFFVWLIRRKKLKEYHSSFLGLIEVWEKYNGEKVLTINKYPHGISTNLKNVEKSYWYYIAQEALRHIQKKKKPEVLFFGLGANTSSRIIDLENPKVHQTIIEIDKNIVEACKIFFHLDDMKHVTIVQGDAYKLIDSRKDFNNKFDVLVVDIFTGIPPYVSTKTNQPPFVKKILKWSKKDGRVIFNRPANIKKGREDTKKLVIYLRTLFNNVKNVYIKDPRGYQNDIVTATGIREAPLK